MELQRCKKHIANPLTDVNGVPTCNICGPEKVEEKQRDTNKRKNTRLISDFSEVTCTFCKKVKKRRKLEGYDYVDDKGGKWLRKRCPECRPTLIYKQNIKRARKLKEKKCGQCKKLFRPKHIKQLYCSLECTKSKKKVLQLPNELTTVHIAAVEIVDQYKTTFENLTLQEALEKTARLPDNSFGNEEATIQELPIITDSYK